MDFTKTFLKLEKQSKPKYLFESILELLLEDFLMSVQSESEFENLINLLIENGLDITRPYGGRSRGYIDYPIVHAILRENNSAAKFFLDRGFNPNEVIDKEGNSLITMAACCGNQELFEMLIEYGANVNLNGAEGQSLFLSALEARNANMIKLLAPKDCNFDSVLPRFFENCYEPSFLEDFQRWSETPILTQLDMYNLAIDLGVDVINWRGEDGNNILFDITGSGEGGAEALKAAIAFGCDPFVINESNENLLFHTVWCDDSFEIFEYLVGLGLDPKQVNNEGENLLFYYVDSKIVEYLLSLGIDVNAQDNEGQTCIFSNSFSSEVLDMLLGAGLDVNHRDNQGQTPLFSDFILESRVKSMIDRGVDINALDNNNETALFAHMEEFSTFFYKRDVVKCLIKNGIDLTQKNNDGKTAYDCLIEYNGNTLDAETVYFAEFLNPKNPKDISSWNR